ncbi:MAG TPA: ABC transporter substrate-binding protein [Stellaceae bacterium]|nr:ABC transporter substrate-binding protein [Stellaceae bacterium]
MTARGVGSALAALAVALFSFAAAAQSRFTDDGGRTVSLPAQVARVMPAGPPASVDLLVLAPQRLIGLTRALSPAQAAYLPAADGRLPAVGRLTGRGETLDLGPVTKAAPDLVVDLGDVNDRFVALANRVQQQTGIPYVLIGGHLADTPATLRKLGTVLGASTRAEALARYAEATLSQVTNRIAEVPAERRPTIYLAQGPRGLETEIDRSISTETVELAGARNVAAAAPAQGGRFAEVSLAQLRAWQPDIIIALDPAFYRAGHDPSWQQLKAVRTKHVYLAPALPFGWVDEPPAANRLIGLRWLAKLLYPARFPEDLRAETRRFYALFYRQEPSDAQLDALLAGAMPPS